MGSLVSKGKSASGLIFTITTAIGLLLQPTKTTVLLITLVGALSALAHFIADMKNKQWSQFAWIWSSFFLPYMVGQFLLLDYLVQYVTVKFLLIILSAYITMLPLMLFVMYKHLFWTCRYL